MGGKLCLAVTFPIPPLPAPGLVNPGLTARDHISPWIRDRALGALLGPVSGLSTWIAETAAFLQHSAPTLP